MRHLRRATHAHTGKRPGPRARVPARRAKDQMACPVGREERQKRAEWAGGYVLSSRRVGVGLLAVAAAGLHRVRSARGLVSAAQQAAGCQRQRSGG